MCSDFFPDIQLVRRSGKFGFYCLAANRRGHQKASGQNQLICSGLFRIQCLMADLQNLKIQRSRHAYQHKVRGSIKNKIQFSNVPTDLPPPLWDLTLWKAKHNIFVAKNILLPGSFLGNILWVPLVFGPPLFTELRCVSVPRHSQRTPPPWPPSRWLAEQHSAGSWLPGPVPSQQQKSGTSQTDEVEALTVVVTSALVRDWYLTVTVNLWGSLHRSPQRRKMKEGQRVKYRKIWKKRRSKRRPAELQDCSHLSLLTVQRLVSHYVPQTFVNGIPLDSGYFETQYGVVIILQQVLKISRNRCSKHVALQVSVRKRTHSGKQGDEEKPNWWVFLSLCAGKVFRLWWISSMPLQQHTSEDAVPEWVALFAIKNVAVWQKASTAEMMFVFCCCF